MIKSQTSDFFKHTLSKINPFSSFIREITLTIIAVITADIVLTVYFLNHIFLIDFPTNVLMGIFVHSSFILAGLGIGYILLLARNFNTIKNIDNFFKSSKLSSRVKYSILKNELEDFQHQLKSISSNKGGIMSLKNGRKYLESLYEKGSQYYSTDLHVPSQFQISQNWYWYFEAQCRFQEKNGRREGRRIHILDYDDIKYDYLLKKEKFLEYEKKNKEMNIQLRVATPETAEFLRSKHRLESLEVGIWLDKYCVHYDRLKSDDLNENRQVRIILYAKNKDDSEYGNNYNECVDYFEELYSRPDTRTFDQIKQQAEIEIKKSAREIQVTSPELADVWDQYLDIQTDTFQEGAFVTEMLRKLHKPRSQISILDAAAQTGRMVIYLYRQNYKKICANSVDQNLRVKLIDNLNREIPNNEIQKEEHDWLLFSKYFRNQKFDLILLTGNFLSRLLNKHERTRTVQQCFSILKSGGIFIVDKRNFDKIYHYKEDDIYSFNKFYDKVYNGKSVYRGTRIRGWPKLIDDNVMELAIGTETSTFPPTFKMYPFRSNAKFDELRNLLIFEAGFEAVEIYGDYDTQTYYRNQSIDQENLASDFIVYVAHKRLE